MITFSGERPEIVSRGLDYVRTMVILVPLRGATSSLAPSMNLASDENDTRLLAIYIVSFFSDQ